MQYFRFVNGVPEEVTLTKFKKENPAVSFPKEIPEKTLAEYGVIPFTVQGIPEVDSSVQRVEPGTFLKTDAGYVKTWNVVDLTVEEKEAIVQSKREGMIVSPRQARLALLGAGLLTQIEAGIAALPEPTKTAVTIEWEYATHVDRNSQWVGALAQALELTDEQLDQLFEVAATL